MTPIFNAILENPKMHIGSNLVLLAENPLQVIWRKSRMPKILGQKGQNDFEGQGQWPPFSILGENILGCLWLGHETMVCAVCVYIRMHILVQIWFQLKFVTSIARKRRSLHAQTYRRADAGNAETP